MAKKGGLGSGLSALFGEDIETAAPAKTNDTPKTLPISKVEPRKGQPRYQFDEDALEELAESIRTHGLIQPITVREIDSGYFQIIAGERRWRAARLAGLEEIPVNIIEVDDRTAMELALVENLQRENLNPIEEARGYRTLMEEYGMTQEEASASVGKSRPAVTNALRLLNLPESVIVHVENNELSAGHARAILAIRDAELQSQAAELVIARQLSVRQTEQLAAHMNKAPKIVESTSVIHVDYVKEAERELENALGRKVKLIDGKKKGRIEIEFYGSEDREKLIENLKLFSSLRRNK